MAQPVHEFVAPPVQAAEQAALGRCFVVAGPLLQPVIAEKTSVRHLLIVNVL